MLCHMHVYTLDSWGSKHNLKGPNQSRLETARAQKQVTEELHPAITAGSFSVLILTDFIAAFGILNNQIFIFVLAIKGVSVAMVSNCNQFFHEK